MRIHHMVGNFHVYKTHMSIMAPKCGIYTLLPSTSVEGKQNCLHLVRLSNFVVKQDKSGFKVTGYQIELVSLPDETTCGGYGCKTQRMRREARHLTLTIVN